MGRFVAFLRGVNVGGNNKVPMAELRDLLAQLGYTDIKTLLNSGNAVFSAPGKADEHARKVQAGIASAMGVEVPVIVKTQAEMDAIARENTLAEAADNHSRLFVTFTPDSVALAALAPLSGLVHPPEQIHLGKHALFLWCPNGVLESKAGEALMGKAGRAGTTRNWATVLKVMSIL